MMIGRRVDRNSHQQQICCWWLFIFNLHTHSECDGFNLRISILIRAPRMGRDGVVIIELT